MKKKLRKTINFTNIHSRFSLDFENGFHKKTFKIYHRIAEKNSKNCSIVVKNKQINSLKIGQINFIQIKNVIKHERKFKKGFT